MSDGELSVELVEARERVPLDAAAWNALVAANETNTIFQTYEWFDAWWRVFGARHDLFMLVIRDGTRICGFAAFMRRRTAFGWRQLEFTGSGNADYQDFILPLDKARALLVICRFLAANWRRWDRLALSNLPGHSSSLPLLGEAAAKCGMYIVEEIQVPCPTLLLSEDPPRAQRMINKYSLRRPLNWFRKHGEVGFRHVDSIERILAFLPAFFEQHRRRWLAVGKPSLFTQENQRSFYEALARNLHPRGWLQFSVVEFNGEPIAFHFGFDYNGCIVWYKPSFDVRYAEHSPGLLLTRQLIEDGLQRSRRELDFTIGDESFKTRFASRLRYNTGLGVYHGPLTHGFAVTVKSLRQSMGRALRKLRLLPRRADPQAPLTFEVGRGAA